MTGWIVVVVLAVLVLCGVQLLRGARKEREDHVAPRAWDEDNEPW